MRTDIHVLTMFYDVDLVLFDSHISVGSDSVADVFPLPEKGS